jgi:hypothetical protein
MAKGKYQQNPKETRASSQGAAIKSKMDVGLPTFCNLTTKAELFYIEI